MARWRFRAVAAVLMALVAAVVVLLFLRFSDLTAEDPGLGIGMRAPVSGPSAP